jgi:protein gp37
MQTTKIEYLTHTWNPIAMRCTPVSDGCKNCWHLRMANRLGGNNSLPRDVKEAYVGGPPVIRQKELSAPIRRKKPSVIGVQFMGDLFHWSVTNDKIAAVFGAMAASPQHIFCVLTKRPERAKDWYRWVDQEKLNGFNGQTDVCLNSALEITDKAVFANTKNHPWPLPNVWLGVSVEDQKTADERIPVLLKIPAAKWFVSVEPMLCPVYVGVYLLDEDGLDVAGGWPQNNPGLDWCIAGSETGPGKRTMNLDWSRDVRDKCQAAGVPFFFKVDSDGNHELDGRLWEEMP